MKSLDVSLVPGCEIFGRFLLGECTQPGTVIFHVANWKITMFDR